ncbi:MAG: hypothetical protein ACQGVK_25090 [Myxococcota bacterium]
MLAGLATLVAFAAPPAWAEAEADPWAGYLDYAYVYSSAESSALSKRLADYARQTGVSLEQYIADRYARPGLDVSAFDETRIRRGAIAYLLQYIATSDSDMLAEAVEMIDRLEGQVGRHENRYWSHYIHAHHALDRRAADTFVSHVLDLWLEVVAPLETPYETLRTLSLSQAPSAGFAAALPYVYENLSRLVLIRSQQMSVDEGLDSLAAMVRMLADGRVGAHPDVIPAEASSREYLDRIVRRLDGHESDGGSLTFTLSLFEARKVHDEARALLATEGLSENTLAAMERTTNAYRAARDRARTTQGHAAVFIRGLRQLGEIYAAKQREGVDPEIVTPFTVGKAMQVYQSLHTGILEDGTPLLELGFRTGARDALVDTLHRLWEEIQETSLNAAAFHLSQAAEGTYRAGEHLRNAARIQARYLDFFQRHLTPDKREGLPDSAFFAAYEAAKGYGDAFLAFPAAQPSATEVDLATRRYVTGLRLFPFDVQLWPSVRSALERQGRVNDYLQLVRPIADSVAKSRFLDSWIQRGGDGARAVGAIRNALSEDLTIMYLGFADGSGVGELEQSLSELRQARKDTSARLAQLRRRLEQITAGAESRGGDAPPASPAGGATASELFAALDKETVERRIDETVLALSRLDKQIRARSRALPLYRSALEADGLARDLAARRDHPVHTLLRRLHEDWEARHGGDEEGR